MPILKLPNRKLSRRLHCLGRATVLVESYRRCPQSKVFFLIFFTFHENRILFQRGWQLEHEITPIMYKQRRNDRFLYRNDIRYDLHNFPQRTDLVKRRPHNRIINCVCVKHRVDENHTQLELIGADCSEAQTAHFRGVTASAENGLIRSIRMNFLLEKLSQQREWRRGELYSPGTLGSVVKAQMHG